MKVPLKAAAVGLLLGILLTIILEVETTEGSALLIILCTLIAMMPGWIASSMRGRANSPDEAPKP